MPPVHPILPVTLADSAAIAATNTTAFWADPHWVLSWRHRTLAYHISQTALRTPRNLLSGRRARRHQKAVDPDTGELVGYARWVLPESMAAGFEVWSETAVPGVSVEEEAEVERVAATAHWDPNEECDHLSEPALAAKREMLGRKEWLLLDHLAVHPDKQGQGIGTALVKSGMEQAARLELDIFAYAKAPGARLYRRLGFRVEREFVFDDSAYGGTGEVYVALMVYEQEASRSEAAVEER